MMTEAISTKRMSSPYSRVFRWLATSLLLLVWLVPLPASAQQARWWAEFYPNATLSGSPVLTRHDSGINFDWGGGAPGAGVPADGFSLRWTRTDWEPR